MKEQREPLQKFKTKELTSSQQIKIVGGNIGGHACMLDDKDNGWLIS